MQQFIDVLRESDLCRADGPRESSIDSLSISKFRKITEAFENAINAEYNPTSNQLASHLATSGLSGDSSECDYIGCRINRMDQLARFSLMYSNKVFVRSYFTKYSGLESKEHLNIAKHDLYNDLKVLHNIVPLIENGYIELYTPEVNVCFYCQAKKVLGENAGKRLDKSYDDLEKQFLDNLSVEAYRRNEGYAFDCSAPKQYFDHARVHIKFETPLPLQKRPSILRRIEEWQKIKLSKTLIHDLGFHHDYAHQVVSNAIYGLTASSCLNTTLLTENQLHIDFLNSLQSDYEVSRRNLMASKYLTSMVPYVEDVALVDLMKLRVREEEAFIQYRHALNKALDTFSTANANFTDKDARALHLDVIAPSIAALDIKVAQAKRDLISKPFRAVAGIVGTISFGLLTGIVPQEVSEIVKALGLLKFGSDLVKDTMAIGDGESTIKQDPFYFLWKVQKLRKHR